MTEILECGDYFVLQVKRCRCGRKAKTFGGHYLADRNRSILAGWCKDSDHEPLTSGPSGYKGPWRVAYGIKADYASE